MPGDLTTGFNVDCRKRVDTLYFHVTDGVERSAMPIAYRQDIVAICTATWFAKVARTKSEEI